MVDVFYNTLNTIMIFLPETAIEAPLKILLQQKVKIHFNNKVWRSGRFLLFKQSGFYLEFIIKSTKRERFEIPIPFDIIVDKKKSKVIFDYRFSTLVHGDKESLQLISKLVKDKKSRFHDTIMEIDIVTEK